MQQRNHCTQNLRSRDPSIIRLRYNPGTTNYNGCSNSDRGVEDSEEITDRETLKRVENNAEEMADTMKRTEDVATCVALLTTTLRADHHGSETRILGSFIHRECRRIDPNPNPMKDRRMQTGLPITKQLRMVQIKNHPRTPNSSRVQSVKT